MSVNGKRIIWVGPDGRVLLDFITPDILTQLIYPDFLTVLNSRQLLAWSPIRLTLFTVLEPPKYTITTFRLEPGSGASLIYRNSTAADLTGFYSFDNLA